jgi:hypothetical protein
MDGSMSTMFFFVRPVSRGRGSSAVGKAAYDARERLRDARTHRTYDYRARGGLDHSEILRPAGTAEEGTGWTRDRGVLWNAAEAAEHRKDSRAAREYVVGLPHELGPEQRLALARHFAQSIADRYGAVVDLAVHSPRPGGDPRNYHAHVLSTTRELTARGLGSKTAIERSDDKRRELGLPRVAEEFKILRRHWAGLANEYLREAGVEARLDPRTFREQGIEWRPQLRLGPRAVEIERRGGNTYAGEWNRRELERRQLLQLEQTAASAVAAGPPPPAAEPATMARTSDTSEQIAARQRSASERWLAYRQGATPEHAPPGREHNRAHEHDLGAEL